jgi:hypothetical protein
MTIVSYRSVSDVVQILEIALQKDFPKPWVTPAATGVASTGYRQERWKLELKMQANRYFLHQAGAGGNSTIGWQWQGLLTGRAENWRQRRRFRRSRPIFMLRPEILGIFGDSSEFLAKIRIFWEKIISFGER